MPPTARRFRLALSDVGQMSLLPHLVSYFDKYAPNISLETVPLSRHGVAEQMSGGEIDLAIGAARPLGAGFSGADSVAFVSFAWSARTTPTFKAASVSSSSCRLHS